MRLHTHPKMEDDFDIPPDHVIIDKHVFDALFRIHGQYVTPNVAVRRDAVAASSSTALLALKERAELAEATLERLALDATDGYVGGAQRLVLKWLQDTKANAGGHHER